MIRVSCFIWLLAFFSCKQNKNNEILPPKIMQQVLWDYIKTDAYITNYVTKDSSQNSQLINANLQQQTLKRYHITREQFDKSYAYYVAHGSELVKITDSIFAKNQREQLSKFVPGALPAKKNRMDSVQVKKSRIKKLSIDSPIIKKPNINKKLYE